MNDSRAWVVSFYGFKGGLGRTLALANVARYLAEEGYRIGLVDLDTESPGLSSEQLSGDSACNNVNDCPGFMELFRRTVDAGRVPKDDPAEFVKSLPQHGNGELFLLPAGKGSRNKDSDYLEAAEQFTKYASALDRETISRATMSILDALDKEYALDYIFIDTRTGAGVFQPTYLYAVNHALVLFMSFNDQSIDGGLAALNQWYSRPTDPQEAHQEYPVFLALGPVPNSSPDMLERRYSDLRKKMDTARLERDCDRDREDRCFYCEFPSTWDFTLPYSDLAAYQETYFMRKYPNSPLVAAYRKLAGAVEGLMKAPPSPETPCPARGDGERPERGPAVRIDGEDTSSSYMAKIFPQRVEGQLSLGNLSIIYHSKESTDEEAPWQSLETIENYLSELSADTGSILMIPQSFLGTIASSEMRSQFWSLEDIRKECRKSLPECLDYGFLDRWYPGWRGWCVTASSKENRSSIAMALPFSATGMLTCFKKGISSPPTNWRTWSKLVTEAKFTFASAKRALYYEWLNVVLGQGGTDFHPTEAYLWEEPTLLDEATIGATKEFLDHYRKSNKLKDKAGMNVVARNFAEGKIDGYFAWSDNFTFDYKDDGPIAATLNESIQTSGNGGKVPFRIGRIPRDVRRRRRPLVAGWVALFPKKDLNFSLIEKQVLPVYNRFLQEESQRTLVRSGFPTCSREIVRQEIRHMELRFGSPEDRQKLEEDLDGYLNYMSFLRAHLDALHSGWVASFDGAHDQFGKIEKALRDLLAVERISRDDIRGVFKNALNGTNSTTP